MMARRRNESESEGVEYPVGVQPFHSEMNVNELVKRLRICAETLQKMDQLGDKKEVVKFRPLAQHLVEASFLESNSKEVKILIACSIAEVLRIFAPEAPYEDPVQQKIVMMFLAKELKGLAHHDSPLFARYFYLLENLACVKSFTIALDLDDGPDVVWEICRICFHVLKPEHPPKVPALMVDLIAPLLQDLDTISTKLLDVILLNVVEPRKSQNREACKMAKELILKSEHCIEPYIQANLNGMLLMGKKSESELVDHLYELIGELMRVIPITIIAVLPQLEFKLKSDDEKERLESMKLLGRLFSEKDSVLAAESANLWECFVGRFQDISAEVRAQALKFCTDLLLNHPDLRKDITEILTQRCRDVEDHVRTEAIISIANAYKKDLTGVADPLLTECLKERTLDKKFKVRREALTSLGVIYRKVMINPDSPIASIKSVEWMKNKILHIYYQSNLEDQFLAERLLNTCLVPYCMETKKRMEMLFELYVTVDENAMKALNEIVKKQHGILETHKQEENSERENFINSKIKTLSDFFLEPQKSFTLFKDFYAFVSEDSRAFKLLEYIVGSDYTCKKIEDTTKEMLVKLSSTTKHQNLYPQVKMLLERASPLMIDSAGVTQLGKILQQGMEAELEIRGVSEEFALERGFYLMVILSCSYGSSFTNQETLEILVFFLQQGHILAGDSVLQILSNISPYLAIDKFPGIYDKILPELKNMALHGSPKQAKHSVQCIFKLAPEKVKIFEELLKSLMKRISVTQIDIQTVFATMAEIGRLCPNEFHIELLRSLKTIVPTILVYHVDVDCGHSTEEWVAEEDISISTKAKVAGIKFMARLLIGIKNLNEHAEWGVKCIKLLTTFIETKGDVDLQPSLCNAEKARLRLTAGCALLKVLREKVYYDMLKLDQFQHLAYLIVDECSQVREHFALKLHKGLSQLKLPMEFLSIYCLVPSLNSGNSSEQRSAIFFRTVGNYIVSNINRRRSLLKRNAAAQAKLQDFMPEYSLTFAVWLLAHHVSLKAHNTISSLRMLKECLWFILEPLTTQKTNDQYSFQFLYKMFQDMKQAKDALDPENQANNQKIWAMCDLGMTLVTYRTHNFTLREHPGKVVLSHRFFTNFIRNENNTELFLPKEIIDEEKSKKGRGKPGRTPAVEVKQEISDEEEDVEEVEKPVSKGARKPIVKGRNTASKTQRLPKKPLVSKKESPKKTAAKVSPQSKGRANQRVLRKRKPTESESEPEQSEEEPEESDDDKPIASVSPKKSATPVSKKPLRRLVLASGSSSEQTTTLAKIAEKKKSTEAASTSYTSKLRKRKSDAMDESSDKAAPATEDLAIPESPAKKSPKKPKVEPVESPSPPRGKKASTANVRQVATSARKSPRHSVKETKVVSPAKGPHRASNVVKANTSGMEEEEESDFEESIEEEEHNTSPVKQRRASNLLPVVPDTVEEENEEESEAEEEESEKENNTAGGFPASLTALADMFDDASEDEEEEDNSDERRITRSTPGSSVQPKLTKDQLIAQRIAQTKRNCLAVGPMEESGDDEEAEDEVPSPSLPKKKGAVRNLTKEMASTSKPVQKGLGRKASNLKQGVKDYLR